jgi:hypothetical protein
MKTKLFKNIFSTLLGLIILVVITACDTNDPNETSISMSFSVNSALPKIAADDFQIQNVKLLVRNIKIKNQSFEDSLHVKTGPVVVDLNLEGKTTEFAYSEIPAGTYNRIRFEIHKIEDSEVPPDSEFKESNESSDRFSVIVKGQLNGELFTYKSRKSAVQDIKLAEDLIVEEGEEANLTITVDPFSWFYEGDKFLDPNDNSNDDKIDNNLKYSFKRAFCDKDKNGLED